MRRRFRLEPQVLLLAASLGACGANKTTTSVDTGLPDDTLVGEGEFSFFAISLKFIKSKAPCQGTDGKTCLGGLGGDLRNGKANGIDGADSLCAEAAQIANPGDRHVWRAFLSAGNYNSAVLNAIDRIGSGPWYSAPPKFQGKTNYANQGLLVAKDKAGLLQTRPAGDAVTVVYHGVNQSMGAGNAQDWPFAQCLTNEFGDCTQADGDDHDTLTGSKTDGTYAGSMAATCDDWTNNTKGYGTPTYGHTWPRQLNSNDRASDWINIGENMSFCGAIINVSTTNYAGGGGAGNPMMDGGAGTPPGGMGGPTDDGGRMPFPTDGGPMMPMDFPDGGMGGPMMGNPPFAMDGGPNGGRPGGGPDGGLMGPGGNPGGDTIGPGANAGGDNMGAGGMGESTDSTYVGGVGSGGGYGGFYCFALVTGAE
jgi:hypothetical protein